MTTTPLAAASRLTASEALALADARIEPHPAVAVRQAMGHLRDRFRPALAQGLTARWSLDLGPQGVWDIRVADRAVRIERSDMTAADVDVRLACDASTWCDIVAGRVDGVRAFQAGRLRIRGDLNLAIRLETLFRPGPEASTPLEIRRTKVKGTTLESLVTGHGRPVVLIHGLAAHKVSFVPTVVGLADAGHQVHAIDLPGFGKSDKPLPAGRRYSMAWMAEQVNGYLIRQNLRDVVLVGNSMGGRIATEVALRNPRAVRGVVGLGAAVAFDEWQRLGPWLSRLQFHWGAAAPPPIKPQWLAAGIRQALFHDQDCLPADNFEAAAEDTLSYIRDARYRLAVAACARHLIRERATGRNGFWERLSGMAVPSYWVWGSHDRLVSSRYAERVRSAMPDARVEVWDGVGHVPQFEVPDRTNAALLDWIDRLP